MNGVALKTAAAALIITVGAVTARIGQEISMVSVNTEETHLLTTLNALSTGIGSMRNNDVIATKTAAPATIVTPMTARIVVSLKAGVITAKTEAAAPATTTNPMSARIVGSLTAGVLMTALIPDLELKSVHQDHVLEISDPVYLMCAPLTKVELRKSFL